MLRFILNIFSLVMGDHLTHDLIIWIPHCLLGKNSLITT